MQQTATDVDHVKRVFFPGSILLILGTQSSSQGASCERKFKNGCTHQIPQQITTLHAKPTTRAQQHGFSKVAFSNSGSRRLLCCGSMANVPSFSSPLSYTPLTLVFVAGSGKSVLWFVLFCCLCLHKLKLLPSSGIIEDIMTERQAESAIVAYFYCDFRDEDKQNCRNLLLSIISQLCAQSDPCCDTVLRVFLAHDDGARKPTDTTLTKCLIEMLSLPIQGPIYLIVDALDECPNNSGMPTSREEVLDLVQDLVGLGLPNLHICMTSRPEVDIQAILDPLTSLCVSLHNQSGQKKDIVDFVSSVVHSDTKMQRWREEDRKLVIETLSERADGM